MDDAGGSVLRGRSTWRVVSTLGLEWSLRCQSARKATDGISVKSECQASMSVMIDVDEVMIYWL